MAAPLYGPSLATTLTATTEADMVTIQSDLTGFRGFVFYLSTDQTGTARVYDIDENDNARLLDTQTITDTGTGVINILDNDYRSPKAKLTFEPDAQPAVIYARGDAY